MGLYRCAAGVVRSVQNFGRGRPVGVHVAPARWLDGVARKLMNVIFACASCGTQLRVASEHAGQRIKCPKCQQVQSVPSEEDHKVLCPICWEVSDWGDLMHIALSEELSSDPILGERHQQRFLATRFNDLGQATDPTGLPCTDLACPHCRRKLPAGYLETPHRIISLVGDAQAGKSYYLAALAKVLPATLFRNFGVTFQDGDPQGNARLNDMRRRLFEAKTREAAHLEKTADQGAMYETVLRRGKSVKLPKPFTYLLGASDGSGEKASWVFYDNAGENFQPGNDINQVPGAQHVASASGILFLFDPFSSSEFRHRIADSKDPQLENLFIDLQDVILSTMRSWIQQLRHLRTTEKIDKPLAVLVGKCDAWMHLLGEDPFQNPVREGWLDSTALQHNSRLIRNLLMEICPSVVGNAESLSNDVLYFCVSSFGHTPIKTLLKSKEEKALPEPSKLRPIFVEVPLLWLFSKLCPQFVPTQPTMSSSNSGRPQTSARTK